ncbi:MAG: TonB family protein [Methyloceanibacter sp.]
MNPVSENRSLPSTLAIGASLVLVCGGLLLLTSTAPWTSRPDSASETPVAANGAPAAAGPATVAVAPAANNGSSPTSEETDEADRGETTQIGEAQPQQAAPEPAEINHFDQSFAQAEAAVATSGVATSSVAQIGAPDEAANAVDATEASAADVSVDVSEVDAPEVEAAAADAIAAESMSVSDAEPMPEDTLEPGTAVETADAGTEPIETAPAAETAAAEPDQIGGMLSESPPATIASETIAEHDNEAAAPSPGAPSAQKIEAPAAEKAEAPSNAPAQAAGDSTSSGQPEEARIEAAAAAPLPSPPPLPKRKPEIQTARAAPQPGPAPSRKETPKQAEARPAVAQAEPAQTGGGFARWLPMALAPADKPVTKEPQRLTGPAYSSKVWSALARHKPRAGQSGSATVVFSIGMGGALNNVSIGKSSGNARIDQLALATVRGAAPFPRPPSGPASFSIRIDFH